jgi:hypothetical protein
MATTLTKSGVNTTFVFDSCFSGGMSRDVINLNGAPGVAKVKYIGPNVTAHMKHVPATDLAKRIDKAKPAAAASDPGEYAFIFAGAEDQPTTDLNFSDPAKPDRGLFSLFFGAILEDDPDVSLEEAITAIQDVLKENKFEQKPGFEFSSPDRGEKGLIEK